MSSVRKRILGSGEIRWQVDYKDQEGKRRAKQFMTKREATEFETKVRGEIAAGVHTADTASITVKQAGELWLTKCETEGLEVSTVRQYRQHLTHHILPLLGDMRLSRLTTPAAEAFRDQLLQTRSKALSRKVLVSLKSILADAKRRGLISQNNAAGTKITIAKRHEEQVTIPSKDEIRALINKTSELWPSLSRMPWRPLVITALFSGMRASELRGLAWDSVDFEDKLIHVRRRADFKNQMGSLKSKAGKRDVPLPPIVLNTLRQWRLACPKSDLNLVFPTRNGTVLTISNIHRNCWRPLLRAAGLVETTNGRETPRYRFHDIRHVAASLFIEQAGSRRRLWSSWAIAAYK